MALAIDKFRQAAPGSRKRTSQCLYERLAGAIEITQMNTNTTSVDKALSSGGETRSQELKQIQRNLRNLRTDEAI